MGDPVIVSEFMNWSSELIEVCTGWETVTVTPSYITM